MKKYLLLTITLLCLLQINAQDLKPVRNGKGLWGFVNTKGDTVIKPFLRYRPGMFKEERAVVRDTNNLFTIIDTKGKLLFPAQYDMILGFKNGFSVVSKKVEDTAKSVIKYTTVKLPKKYITQYGMIDKTGKAIIPPVYNNILGDFSNGWFVIAVLPGYKYRYFDKKGDTITLPAGMGL